jgi:hypothetical protein
MGLEKIQGQYGSLLSTWPFVKWLFLNNLYVLALSNGVQDFELPDPPTNIMILNTAFYIKRR